MRFPPGPRISVIRPAPSRTNVRWRSVDGEVTPSDETISLFPLRSVRDFSPPKRSMIRTMPSLVVSLKSVGS